MNNKIILLAEVKMMQQNWSAWTPDSYYSTISNLTDEEIESFIKLSDLELNELREKTEEYCRLNCTY